MTKTRVLPRDYWLLRHDDSVARAHKAPTARLRAIYLELAAHYRLLHERGQVASEDKAPLLAGP